MHMSSENTGAPRGTWPFTLIASWRQLTGPEVSMDSHQGSDSFLGILGSDMVSPEAKSEPVLSPPEGNQCLQ